MKHEVITAWITKYALTGGIQKIEAEVCSPSMISYRVETDGFVQHAHGKDWHRTPHEAIARAREMRKRKVDSLRKQVMKLEVMEFAAHE